MVATTHHDDVPSSLLVIGCGNMGAAIIEAVAAAFPLMKITAVDPDIDRAKTLLAHSANTRLVASVAEIADDAFDVAIVAVKPQHALASIEDARRGLERALIISITAGMPLSALLLVAPQTARMVRVMPNLPATVRAAMTVGVCDKSRISDHDRRTVERIFEALGRFLWLSSEAEIDAATAISGSGPGYVFAFAEQLANAGVALGLSGDVAQELARQTIVGAARMLDSDPRSANDMKRAVTSPGGTTAAALSVLEANEGLPKYVSRAAFAAMQRARELAEISK